MIHQFEGYVCLEGTDLELFEFLDNKFLSFIEHTSPKHYHIPALIEEDVLEKCGYFRSFPQQIISAAFVDEQHCNYTIDSNHVTKDHIFLKKLYMTPSACLHLYPSLQGKHIDNATLTTKARVYRHEKKEDIGLTRLIDFTVREIVFVGKREFVQEMLTTTLNFAVQFAKTISENASIASASDCFYPNKINQTKSKFQIVNKSKKELIVPVGDKIVAVGSSNYHDFHFSVPFKFDQNKQIVSGCIGFGLERWLAACKEYKFKY